MATLTPELIEYLTPSDLPRQVLVKVRPHPQSSPDRLTDELSYDMALRAAQNARKDLMQVLKRERALDNRIQFNPLGIFDHIALVAPRDVIKRIAGRQDVDEIIPDEPTGVIDED
jgi:hypothetical protein